MADDERLLGHDRFLTEVGKRRLYALHRHRTVWAQGSTGQCPLWK
jgi:hypothetical protein